MSAGSLVTEFVIKYKDNASAPATRALQSIDRGLKGVTKSGKEAKTASEMAISVFAKMANARSVLGVRSEKDIQNEIRRTEAAYQRLAQSGTASQRELARAAEASKNKVAQLSEEMGKTSRLGSVARGVGMGYAAYQAGKFALADPIRQTMNYDRQLANLSNTAYAGQSLDDRRTGMRTLDEAIKASVHKGGGSRELAMAALSKLTSSGVYSNVGDALSVLPDITQAASATGGNAEQFANIALAARRNMGLTDFKRVANMATKAGQGGGFEITDMAKALPEQLAAAKNAGLTGYKGYGALLALNQASVTTAGSTDTAANNVVNLLNKINSRDTAMDFQRQGIDLNGSLLKAIGSGTNTLEAFGGLVDHVIAKDPRYAELKNKAKSQKIGSAEQQETYSSMAQIVEGAGIGKVLQDKQALMAFLAYRNQHELYGQFGSETRKIMNPGDPNGANFALISETPSYKAEQMATEKAMALQTALDGVNPLLGGMSEVLTDVMRNFPLFSASIIGATTMLTALALAAGAAGGVSLITGGKASAAGEMAKKVMTLGGVIPAAGSWFAGLGGGGAMGAGIAGAGLTAAGAAGYGIGTGIDWLSGKAIKAATGGTDDSIGSLIYSLLNREKEPPIEINLNIDGEKVAKVVNARNSRQASRH